MQFSADMIEAILAENKSQTRRPIKLGEWGEQHPFNETFVAVHTRDRVKWEIGHSYAVCPGRGQQAIARITILKIQSDFFCNISEEDARAEGFRTREEFFDKLRALYGKEVDLEAACWVLTFRLQKRR